MSEARQRLFFALWPPVELARELRKLARDHFDWRHARLLSVDQIHLTLFYLGPSDVDQRQCAESVAGQILVEPFNLALSKLGVWPRPRIGWIAPQETPEALPRLALQLQQGLGDCGYPAEDRPYQAHITLLRKLRRPPVVMQLEQPLSWTVEEFVLVESQTLPAGAQYQIVQRWPLKT